jgi:O-antigen/teichoic acid export membrane protein
MNASLPLVRRWSSELGQLLRGSAFIFAVRIAGAGLTLGVQILLARSMGAEELGVYTLAFSWCVLLANASTQGFAPAAMRFVGEGRVRGGPGYARAFVRFAIRITVLTGICIAVVGGGLVQWLMPDSVHVNTMTAALAIMPVLAMMHLCGGFANGYSRFALGFLPTSVLRPLCFCALVALFWLQGWPMDAEVAMYGNVASIMVVAVPVFVLSRALINREDPVRGTTRNTGEPKLWIRTSSSMMIPALFTAYFGDLIVILAGFFLPSGELAVLNICLRLATLVTFALAAIDSFTGPQMAYEYAAGRMDAVLRIVNRATRLRFWIALAATVTFVTLGGPILSMFGEEFRSGYPLLVILACGQLVQGAVGPVVRLIGLSEQPQRCVPVFVVCFFVSIVLVVALAPRFGAMGVAFTTAFVMAAWGIWIRRLTVRHMGIRPRII